MEFEVELEKPVATPKPVVRAVAAPVKTIEAPKAAQEAVAAGVTAVRSPLPGTVVDIKVAVGDTVTKGQTLVILEAMKMENNIPTNYSGKVKQILVAVGDAVPAGGVLVEVE